MVHAYVRGKRADGRKARVETHYPNSMAEFHAGATVEFIAGVERHGRCTVEVSSDGLVRVFFSEEGEPEKTKDNPAYSKTMLPNSNSL